MVIEDKIRVDKSQQHKSLESDKLNTNHSDSKLPTLATPIDRLAAFIIDTFIVYASIFWLIIAPWRKNLKWSMITDNPYAMSQSLLSILSLYILSMIMYRAFVSLYFKGQTIGQMCFKLRVVDCWTHQVPSPKALALRAFLWVMESLLLGLPFIAILLDPRHRSLHDKMSDTMVIHYGEKPYERPPRRVVAMGQIIYGSLLLFPIIVILMAAPGWINEMSQPQGDIRTVDFNITTGCSEVVEILQNTTRKTDQLDSRMTISLELYLTGAIGSQCLEEEVFMSSQAEVSLEWTYLAKAYIYQTNIKRRDSYLDLICQDWKMSVACMMAKAMKKSWHPILTLEPDYKKIFDHDEATAKLWGLIQLSKSGNYSIAKDYLKKLSHTGWLSQYLISLQTKLEYSLNRKSEARAMAKIIYMAYPDDLSVASWMCGEELFSGCTGAESESCHKLQKESWSLGLPLKNPNNALAYIKARECNKQHSVDNYLELAKNVSLIEVKLLLRALALDSAGQNLESHKVLRKIIGAKNYFPRVRHEALLRLIPLLEEREALWELGKNWWGNADLNEWKKTGRVLISQMTKMGFFDLVLKTGQLWQKTTPINNFVLKQMLRAHYRMGEDQKGFELYENHKALLPGHRSRKPAATNEMDLIIKKFKGKRK